MTHSLGLSPAGVDDLKRSGLVPAQIAARPITTAELSATNSPPTSRMPDGYVLPYFDIQGKPVPYYRLKFIEPMAGPKYRAITGESNHIYFPIGVHELLRSKPKYIIITEGEKKAACAVAHKFPCIGLSGVDNWRNRHLILPQNTELKAMKARGVIRAKIPGGDSNSLVVQESGVVAVGFNEFVNYCVANDITVIIIFDTDKEGVKNEVQRAAATLGYELRYRGIPIPRIRQLFLPPISGDKTGLDDYLVKAGSKEFARILRICLAKRIAFPRHPNPKTFIASRLQKSRLSRKETQDVSLSILMELEGKGRRLRNEVTHETFFFDEKSHTLMDVHLGSPRIMLHDTPFGSYLYREFNLSATDQKIVGWLASQFHGEPGVEDATTHKVLALPKGRQDSIAYQLSDSHFIIISGNPLKPYEVCENGQHGVLFEQGQVKPIAQADIEVELDEQLDPESDVFSKVLWSKVMKGFNFATEGEEDESKKLATLLYYLSPWFLRWRGTQLPVELVMGEPGSGKSSLYELRQMIITGYPRLSNMTNDIKDWYAAITSHGGMHIMDNVHFAAGHKDYQQRLSDELCRLVTEPQPHVELRKLYTTSDVLNLPVNTTFALTALEQPFYGTDLIQRAAIFELQSISSGHDARWTQHQLDMGRGRVGWVAHQLAVMHKFMRKAIHERRWDNNYRAHHRLANYEQALIIMAEVLGMETEWIPKTLATTTSKKMSEADWTMGGLKEFCASYARQYPKDYPHRKFAISDIVAWAELQDEYEKNPLLTNSWRLGKYVKTRRGAIKQALGMYANGSKMNKIVYSIEERTST